MTRLFCILIFARLRLLGKQPRPQRICPGALDHQRNHPASNGTAAGEGGPGTRGPVFNPSHHGPNFRHPAA